MMKARGEELKIAYVEDDKDDRDFFVDTLKGLNINFEVTHFDFCDHLQNALLKKKCYDIIFLNFRMLRISGTDCIKEIKTYENCKTTPIIFLSGIGCSPDQIDDAYKSGAHYFINKPINLSDYQCIMKELLFEKNLQKMQRPARNEFLIKQPADIQNI